MRLTKTARLILAWSCLGLLVAAAGPVGQARADESVLRIGVLNDMSGPYSDFQGPGSVVAAQMAVEDYGGKAAHRRVVVLSADHQNKPDVGSALARSWIDTEDVQALVDLPNSAVALAVNQIVKEKNKALLASGAGTALLTGEQCTPNTVQWTYDTYEDGHALAHAVMERGGKTWFFITADYAFGHDLQKQASEQVLREGGRVLGSVAPPLGAGDFASYLLQAQSSGAQVVALANAGADETNTIKQADEFGLRQKQLLVGMIFGLQNVPALGLQASQGLMTVQSWYWDSNPDTRAFAARYQSRHPKHAMPNDMQAGVYTIVLHYLKAVDKVGSASDGRAVVAAMKAMPVEDSVYGKGSIREDGRGMHPVLLTQVKAPGESKGPWDYFKILATIPADKAFRPLKDGSCPLVTGTK